MGAQISSLVLLPKMHISWHGFPTLSEQKGDHEKRRILDKMPKDALLHAHFDAMIDVD